MKKITINDIAKMAGTSKTTVSFYLNGKYNKMSEDTKNRIEKVIEENKYIPNNAARAINNKSSKTIGVVISSITNGFSNKLVSGIEESALEKDYQIIVGSSHSEPNREFKCVENMIKCNVDGFIVQPSMEFKKTLDLIKRYDIPIVYVDSHLYTEDIPLVKTNNYKSTYEFTKYLIRKGYNNFLIIEADPSNLSTRLERHDGFYDALDETKFPIQEFIVKNKNDKMLVKKLVEFVSENIDLTKRTVVFSPNCWMLPKVYESLKSFYGLMPNQLGLYGFDNDEWVNSVTPSVSSIIQPAYEEGKVGFNLLYEMIKGRNIGYKKEVLNCDLILNESVL